jgi:hypothetical protein
LGDALRRARRLSERGCAANGANAVPSQPPAPWVYFEVIQAQTALRGVPMLFKSRFTVEDYEGDIDGSTVGTSGLILVRSDFGSQSA